MIRMKMLNILLISMIISCSSSLEGTTNQDDVRKTNLETDITVFEKFAKNFKKVDLPYEVCHFCDGSFKDIGEIEPDFVDKFILLGNKKAIENKVGHQFYYQERIELPDVIGLIFYKTSDALFEYIMYTFDNKGNYKDEVVLACIFGEYDTEREQSSFINNEGEIIKTDLTLILSKDSASLEQKANKRDIFYQINNDGKVEVIREQEFGIVNMLINEHGNFKEERK